MDPKEIDARVGEAWKAHRTGNIEAAIEQFSRILAEVPDHIDATWGLALAYRKAGDREKSLQTFKTAADLIAARSGSEEDKERHFMLQRMIKQQIEQMADFI